MAGDGVKTAAALCQLKAGGFFDDNADKSADMFGCYLGEAGKSNYPPNPNLLGQRRPVR